MARAEEAITSATLAERLPESEQRLVYELAFEEKGQSAGTLEEARSCLAAMQARVWEKRLQDLSRRIDEAVKKGDMTERDKLNKEKQAAYQQWQDFRRLHHKDTF